MDSEQDKPTSQQRASAPGAALAAAREAMGLSVDQIADQLKLAPRQVVAIEQGDYDALPNRAVTRGFIRAYAKAVRLDPAPLVAMVQVEGAEGHAAATVRPTRVRASFQESRFPSLNERNNGKPVGAIVAGVAVLALAGVAAAWQMGFLAPLTLATRGGVDAPATTETPVPMVVTQPGTPAAEGPLQSPNVPLISVPPPAGSTNMPATVPGAGVPAAPGAAPAGAGGTAAAPAGAAAPATAPGAAGVAPVNRPAPGAGGVPPAGTAPAPAGATPGANAPASPGLMPARPAAGVTPGANVPGAAPLVSAPAPAAAAAPSGPAPAVGAAGGKLVLTVKENSWIEIRRPGQAKLIAREVRAGSTQAFDVRADDILIVGKPGGVSASLAGAQLALPQEAGKTYSLVNIK